MTFNNTVISKAVIFTIFKNIGIRYKEDVMNEEW